MNLRYEGTELDEALSVFENLYKIKTPSRIQETRRMLGTIPNEEIESFGMIELYPAQSKEKLRYFLLGYLNGTSCTKAITQIISTPDREKTATLKEAYRIGILERAKVELAKKQTPANA